MRGKRFSGRRWALRILLVCVALAGVGVSGMAVADQVRLRSWRAGVGDPDPAVRRRALRRIAREREKRAADVVLSALETEQDRVVLDEVGYAAMRLGDRRGLTRLRRRADEGPDDPVRAKLILYAARLSRRDGRLTDWLTAGVQSSEPWRRVGSVVGLLELGQPQAGELLIDVAGEVEPPPRAMALHEFQRIAGPMAETVGWPIRWPDPQPAPGEEERWADLRAFWRRHGSVHLLNDVLTRLHQRDRQWREVNRLLHGRDRFARYFE